MDPELKEIKIDCTPDCNCDPCNCDSCNCSKPYIRAGTLTGQMEEPWNQVTEDLANKWLEQASSASDAHAKAGLKKKALHVRWGLPALLIPAIMSPLSVGLAEFEGIQYGNMSAFILTAVCTGVHSFFKYDYLHAKHMEYSARYGNLKTDIVRELSKGKAFRRPTDEFLAIVESKLDALNSSAPDL